MTSVDQHHARPANQFELLGATHAWRAVIRQAAAHIGCLAEFPSDRPTRSALRDVLAHLNKASALLTTIDATLDATAPSARREHARADLALQAERK